MAREKGWNLLCKFFDNLGPIPHHMHQSDEAREARRPPRQARGVLLSAAVQPDRQQLSATPSWGSNPARRRTTCGGAWRTGTGATTASLFLVARLPARARHRLADRSGHSPRARVAADLRAAGEQRRVRDVPVGGRRAHHRLESARQGRAAAKATHDLDYIIGMLDWDANVNPRFGESNRRFPEAGEAVRGDRAGRLSRAVGHATAPAGIRRRS